MLPNGDRARSEAPSSRHETAVGTGFPAAERSTRSSLTDAFAEAEDVLDEDDLELDDADECAEVEVEVEEDPQAIKPSINISARRTARTPRTVGQRSAAGQTSR
ncbi:MAG: hypothetical protein ABI323_15185 [Solirubrobacteraceae bacterium]